MRRIFGGTNLTVSPSDPSHPTFSPTLSSGRSTNNEQPLTPTALDSPPSTGFSASNEGGVKKSWFGAALNGVVGGAGAVGGVVRSPTAESRPQRDGPRSVGLGREDSASSSSQGGYSTTGYSATASTGRREGETEITRPSLAGSFSTTSVATIMNLKGDSGAYANGKGAGTSGTSYVREKYDEDDLTTTTTTTDSSFSALGTVGTVGEDKDIFMLELLSGQAIVDSKDFEILDWSELESTKKEQQLLSTRLASIRQSLALEMRLRATTAKLLRLSSPSPSLSSPRTPQTSNGSSPRVRSPVIPEQVEEKLNLSNLKIEKLEKEIYDLASKENVLSTKLLRHNGAVLSRAYRRTAATESTEGVAHHERAVLSKSTSFAAELQLQLQQSIRQPLFPLSNSQELTFEGASFYSGNKDAVIPLPRNFPSSPSPGKSDFGPPSPRPKLSPPITTGQHRPPTLDPVSFGHDMTFVRELEEKVRALEDKLKASQNELVEVKKETEKGIRDRDVASSQTKTREIQETELKRRIEEMERERGESQAAARRLEEESQSREKRLEELEVELGKTKKELVDSSASGKEVVNLRDELLALTQKLSNVTLEQQETQARFESAEEHAHALERELEEEKSHHQSEIESLHQSLEEGQSRLEAHHKEASESSGVVSAERQKIVEAIGDVLRRHRTRPVIGPVLRNLPSFDDTTSRDDLPFYLASTLESHFDRLSNHVATISSELDLAKVEHGVSAESLEMQLKEAIEASEKLRGEAEAATRENAALETAKRDLQTQFEAREVEEIKLRQDLDALTTRSTESANQQTKTLKSLQEIWRVIPPLESRAVNSNSDDLTTLKGAFELTKKPSGVFSADLNAAKFSVDSLVERIRLLLTEDAKLVQKLIKVEAEQGVHKSSAEKAQTMLAESNAGIQVFQKQVKELEERMEISSNQEVRMLERLNDLTESLEQTRAEKRKLETSLRSLEAEKVTLNQQLASAQHEASELNQKVADFAKFEALEAQFEELQHQLSDTEAELEDAKKREQKQRNAMLTELNEVQSELTSVKTQLRQALRKQSKP